MNAPTVTAATNPPRLPNQPFFSWLRTHTTLYVGQLVGLMSVVSVPVALVYYSIHGGLPLDMDFGTVGRLVIYAHLPFLAAFIAVLIRMLDNNSRGRYRAGLVREKLGGKSTNVERVEKYSVKQVAKFKHRFLWFWCAMFLLYVAFAFEPDSPPKATETLHGAAMFSQQVFPFLTFALNNLSLTLVFCCFAVFYLPVDATRSDPISSSTCNLVPREQNRSRFSSFTHRNLRRLSRRPLRELEFRQRRMVLGFIIFVTALTLAYPLIICTKNGVETNWTEYPAVFDALSGTLNAVVLALLVARLDSKLIGLPSWLICVLYFYAGVQPLFVVFEIQPEKYVGIRTAVLLVVFVFKIYFFLIIVYALQTGRVFNYFFCSRILNEHVKELTERPEETSNDQNPATHLEDSRARWFRYLGWFAITFFAGSLLWYVAGDQTNNMIATSVRVSSYIIYLHLLLLVAIGAIVGRAWYKGSNSGPQLSEKSRRRLFKLREMFSAPESPKVEELRFQQLSARTDKQIESFTLYFRFFWFFLFLLYAVMAVDMLVTTYHAEATLASLASRTVAKAPQVGQGAATGKVIELLSVGKVLLETKFSLILFVVNAITVLILFWCFTVLYVPANQGNFEEKRRLLRNYSLLICVLLTVLVPLVVAIIKTDGFTQSEVDKLPTILGAVGGTLNAVAFALLIARLDSRLIGLRSSLVSILYAYAALQPLFVTFEQRSDLLKAIATSAMIAAFIFKICLVLMVGHVRNSFGLSKYLWFFPVLHKCVNSVFGNQFEIRSYRPERGLFTFSIFDNNVEKYRAAEEYKTQEGCDAQVELAVSRMKERNAYLKPKPLQGTYWLQVTGSDSPHTGIICESTSLGSEDERRDLIDESIEKVPSCKYVRG